MFTKIINIKNYKNINKKTSNEKNRHSSSVYAIRK